VILSLYWQSMTRAGALAGILVGGMTVVLWKQLAPLGGVFELYELVPGFLLSTAAIMLTSRMTSKRNS
jgi:sodium/proline symporter